MNTLLKLTFCLFLTTCLWYKSSAQVPQVQLKFFGTTYGDGDCNGVLFEFCPYTGKITKSCSLPTQTQGIYVPGSLTLYERNLFGMAYVGGEYDFGYIFKWNLATNSIQIIYECNASNDYYPIGSMVLQNGKLYGMISDGDVPNKGLIFELNPVTNIISKKVVFLGGATGNFRGAYPYGDLTYYNLKFYGMTKAGGLNNKGVIFEWDPVTNQMETKIDLSNAGGSYPTGSLTMYNGKFYGMTVFGGDYDNGVIFEWDPATNVFSKKYSFDGIKIKRGYGNLTLLNNKFYGMSWGGGENDGGIIFEWNPQNNNIVKRKDLNALGASHAFGSMAIYKDKLYGMTYSGGANDLGIIFEWNPVTNNFVKLLDFNGTNGGHPLYTKLVLQDWWNIPDSPEKTILGDTQVESNFSPQVYVANQCIHINNNWNKSALMYVYDLSGREVASYLVYLGTNIFKPNLLNGVYIIKMANSDHVYYSKIFLK